VALVRTAKLLRSLTLLGVFGASLVLFFQEAFAPEQDIATRENAIPWEVRTRLIVVMGVAFAIAAALGALLAWRCGAARARWLSRRLAPGIVLGLAAPLLHPDAWPDALVAVLAIAGVTVLTEALLRVSLGADRELDGETVRPLLPPSGREPVARWTAHARSLAQRVARAAPKTARRWGPVAVVVAAAAGYAVYMSVFTLRMHGRFGTYGYDLGQNDNVFWSTLHGHPLRDSPLDLRTDWSELRNHADLSTFFLLPFYAIHPGAPALLVIQACVLGLGAIPLYRFGARRLPRGYACLVALAYLLYPPLHGLQFYDFHFQPIASTFVLFVVDFVDEKRYALATIAFVVALGCREDVGIGLAILGAFLALSGYRPRAGAAMAVVAAGYFALMSFVVMPHMGRSKFGLWTALYIYKDLIPRDAHGLSSVIATLASNPDYVFKTLVTGEKLRYAAQILTPLAFLPTRRAYLLLALVHGSLLTLLTTGYGPTIDIGFQYVADFIPYVFPASVLALEALGKGDGGPARRQSATAAMLVGTALCGVFWGAIPPRETFHGGFDTLPMTAPTEADRRKEADLRALAARVPPEAWLAVSEHEMPHLSRLNMLSLRDTTDADYLLYAEGSGFFGSDRAERALREGKFVVVAERPGLVLLKRKGR